MALGRKPGAIATISGPNSLVAGFGFGRKTTVMPASEGSPNLALNTSGTMVAAGKAGDNAVQVWKTEDGTPLTELPTDGRAGILFALGDSLLVLCDRRHIPAYQTKDWKMRWQTKREAAADALRIWMSASPETDVRPAEVMERIKDALRFALDL